MLWCLSMKCHKRAKCISWNISWKIFASGESSKWWGDFTILPCCAPASCNKLNELQTSTGQGLEESLKCIGSTTAECFAFAVTVRTNISPAAVQLKEVKIPRHYFLFALPPIRFDPQQLVLSGMCFKRHGDWLIYERVCKKKKKGRWSSATAETVIKRLKQN